MSRIGNQPIVLGEGVSVSIRGREVEVSGPRGILRQHVDASIQVALDKETGVVVLKRKSEQKRHRAFHGLYRSLLNNMILGVKDGFVKELELVGVGYKAALVSGALELNLGYAHPIYMVLPEEVTCVVEAPKGRAGTSFFKLRLESHDKQLLGQVVAKIRALRKVEPYKGKGIRFVGEQIRRKAGKAAKKA